MKLITINPLEYPNWDEQIQKLAGSTIFHTSVWARVLAESYGYRPVYFCAFQDRQLAGVLPVMEVHSLLTGRRGVSLPFTDECRAIFNSKEIFESVWHQARNYGDKAGWRYIELRGQQEALSEKPVHAKFMVHTLSLDFEQRNLFNRFRDSTRRNIKKALKQEVTAVHSNDLQAIDAFYQLNCKTRRMHGLPPQPFHFFKKLHKYIIAPMHGFVTLAIYNGAAIAAAVFFKFKDNLLYKYGASEKDHQHLRANNLVMWAAIQWANQNRLQHVNFGRTEPANNGLMQFKRGWGTFETTLNYYRYEVKTRNFISELPKLKSSYPVFTKMPLPVLKALGRILYRHAG